MVMNRREDPEGPKKPKKDKKGKKVIDYGGIKASLQGRKTKGRGETVKKGKAGNGK